MTKTCIVCFVRPQTGLDEMCDPCRDRKYMVENLVNLKSENIKLYSAANTVRFAWNDHQLNGTQENKIMLSRAMIELAKVLDQIGTKSVY